MRNSTDSKTTTSPVARNSLIGVGHGSPGSTAPISDRSTDREMVARKHVFAQLPNTPEQCSEFRAALSAPPASPQWIEVRVRALASLYFVPNERPEVLAMAMQRWVAIIGEVPGPLAAWAFDEWERTQTHRPSPAHIRQLASKRRRDFSGFLPKPAEPRPEPPHITPEGRERIDRAMTAMREGLGFEAALKAMDDGAAQ